MLKTLFDMHTFSPSIRFKPSCQRVEDATRGYRNFRYLDMQRPQRVIDGVGNCRGRTDSATFANALDAEFGIR